MIKGWDLGLEGMKCGGRRVLEIPSALGPALISQKVFIKSFCKSQFPHKSVNLFFILVIIKDKLTNLCGN